MSDTKKISLEKFEAAKAAREAALDALEAFGEATSALGVAVALEAWPALSENPDTAPLGTFEVPTNPFDDGADVIVTLTIPFESLPTRTCRFYFHLDSGPERLQDFIDYVEGAAEDAKACVEVLREYGILEPGVVGSSGLERAAPQSPGHARFLWVRRARTQSEEYRAVSMEDVDTLRRGLSWLEGRR